MTLTPTLPGLEPTTPADSPRPGSRAARMLMPRSVDVVKDLAADYGVCTRPVSLRRTDLSSGQTEVIDLPCGATQEAKCPACATRARRLRQQQIREGWHRDDEPDPGPRPATEAQQALIVARAHLEFARDEAARTSQWDQVADLDDAIGELEAEITTEGMRGRPAPPHASEDQEDGDGKRRVRSTKRRQDAPDLPRLPVENRTLGRTFEGHGGMVFRPSMFLTLTLGSYGRVHSDGTPVDPDAYDYRRAAWDAVHFPRLLDRFWQNLRRAVGWNVQYAGAVEPQRRLAPHAHFAMRGTIPRALVRQVAAATYHQVWWPPVTEVVYEPGRAPRWDADAAGYTDPTTGRLLPSWDDALDLLDADPDAEPVHVVRFGTQVDAKGVLAGSKDADRCVGYITKYLTKQAADCHDVTTGRQRAHLERLWQELRHTPCSERCANWLLYGIQPKKARPGLKPGNCKNKVHKRDTLGIGGRRVLISRQWSGKTLTDHRADRRDWVKALLGVTTDADTAPAGSGTVRHAWELAKPTDPDVPPIGHRVLRAISERIQWRAQLDAARRAAADPPDVSATTPRQSTEQEGTRA
ncbi:replication initiation protein [Micromonospora aurantiaca]|uniref:Replication initiation protein n=1 Tax=Micromonospora aurantiaca (nom. illeg.) TaxID=47850 RepID=A0ABQ6UFY7_9ACTN|nr:replication initiator [Micromonospora aurantiaca]KAB1112434.1 replication initiation protein [Micromonospora aurantiaca]